MFTLIIDEDLTPKMVSAQDIEDMLSQEMKHGKNPKLYLIKSSPTLETVSEESPIQGINEKIEEYHKDDRLLKIIYSSDDEKFTFEFAPLSDTIYLHTTTLM